MDRPTDWSVMSVVGFAGYQQKAKRLDLLEKLYIASLKLEAAMKMPEAAHKHQALADWMLATQAVKDFDNKPTAA